MTRTLSREDYQELGKSYYKLKQYDKAIEAFTNGIEASAVPSATLYDYRAASYEKLADFNSAIKDGRETIRTHKQDVRGYLRTANALIKLNKLDTALNIFKYGMKNVPVGNKDFQLLQRSHDKLTRQLSPPKAIDPFTILPVELAEMVLGYVSFKTIVKCLRVSRGWKNYLTKRHKLWAEIDFSEATRPVSRASLRNAVQYSQNTLHTLIAHRVQHVDMLRNIATACQSLRSLTIMEFPYLVSGSLIEIAQRARNLKVLTVHSEVTMDTIGQILRRRPELERIDFKDISTDSQTGVTWEGGPFTKLEYISLRGSREKPGRRPCGYQVIDLVQQAPQLQWLYYIDGRRDTTAVAKFHQTSLRGLVLKNVNLLLPRLPPTLEHLVFDPPSGFAHDLVLAIGLSAMSRTSSLVSLTLGASMTLYPSFLTTLLDHVKHDDDGTLETLQDGAPLRSLSISGEVYAEDGQASVTIDHQAVAKVAAAPRRLLVSTYLATSPRILTRSLTSLEVPGLPLTDDDIRVITESTSLTYIDVSKTEITGFGIKQLADQAPTLRHIKADHCRNLSSRDAIEYAESKGVYVSYTMAESGGKGRKVRYG